MFMYVLVILHLYVYVTNTLMYTVCGWISIVREACNKSRLLIMIEKDYVFVDSDIAKLWRNSKFGPVFASLDYV